MDLLCLVQQNADEHMCVMLCSQIYFTGGFNRWNHKRALGPVKMRPPGPNGRHWQVRGAKHAHFASVPLICWLCGLFVN
jgi:hypothetical protein